MTIRLLTEDEAAEAKARAKEEYRELLDGKMSMETRRFKDAKDRHDRARKMYVLDDAQLERWWG